MCSDHWRSFQNLNWQQNAKVWNSNTSCTFVYLQRIIWMTLGKEISFRSRVCVCVCVFFFSTTNGQVQVYIISQKKKYFPKNVQFGNFFSQKIPLTAKLDSAYGLVQFWLSSEFFSSNYFQIGQHVVLLHIQIRPSIFALNPKPGQKYFNYTHRRKSTPNLK